MPRPTSPLITRDTAVRAALHAIDESGLESFSLGLVARRLGVSTPSLYHHFRDKNEILAEVARLILLQGEDSSRVRNEDWREALVALSVSVRRSILRHPNAAPLLLMYPPRHLVLQGYERSLRLFEKKGVPKELHIVIVSGMDSIVFGTALLLAASRAQGVELFPKFDPRGFPALTAAIEANQLEEEEVFVRVARAFLEGICPTSVRSSKRAR
jgi:AcrR family transcriptional regulator